MHKNNCEWEVCKYGMKAVEAQEKEKMKKYGWISHLIVGGHTADLHTHGIAESFGHLDLQICLPIDPKIGQSILHSVVDLIKEGKVFKDCQETDDIIENYNVMFLKVTENNRDVLRIILPDPMGKLKPEEIDEKYKIQYEGTPYILYEKGN